jgi:nitroreductase
MCYPHTGAQASFLKFEQVIAERRSVRRYKNTKVSRESIMKVLEAARLAPSASHRQPWHFIVVEDKDTILRLAGSSKWAADAPVMIVGLADPTASPTWFFHDLGIAFEHIILTATSLGLGTCWMGQSRRDDEVKEILGIPPELKVIALTPIGEPDEIPAPKVRNSLDEIVSWEKYGRKT